MIKALILTDGPHWAYASIAQSLIKYNSDPYVDLSMMHIKGNVDHIKKHYKEYDKILVMGFQNAEMLPFLNKKEITVGIHSHHSWDDKKTTPDKDVDPPQKLIDQLNEFKAVNTVSWRLFLLFKKAGVEHLCYTPNGVDHKLFVPADTNNDGEFYVGYSGSQKHDWRKGVTDLIIPAAKKAGVKTKIAMLSTGSYLPLEEMPQFYQGLDAYICASQSEGFSLSVLEAASCGVPIISTRVGGCIELIQSGINGFLVDRNVDEIVKRIERLKEDIDLKNRISKQIREDIVNFHGWNLKHKAWVDFIVK